MKKYFFLLLIVIGISSCKTADPTEPENDLTQYVDLMIGTDATG